MTQKQTENTTQKQQISQNNLVLNQKFTYQFFENNRYTISEVGNYQALCNNCFIKLYTKLCRVYWHAQNQFSHQIPDWKFHISVAHKDLKKAWNLIAAIFCKFNCRAGVKVIYLKEIQNPQRGREITLYIVKYDQLLNSSTFAGQFGLGIDIEHSQDYWFKICQQIENVLNLYQIQSNGLADGDYALGKYISLRNQAFVKNSQGESIYPPNSAGWNPLKQILPINLNRFKRLNQRQEIRTNKISEYKSIIFLSIILISAGLWIKMKMKVF